MERPLHTGLTHATGQQLLGFGPSPDIGSCDIVAHLNSSSASLSRRDRSPSLWQPVLVTGASLILAVRLFRQVSQYAVNIFFSDQWDVDNATLFQRHSLWEMFRWQYGPHRQGVGALFSMVVEPHFQWNSRVEAILATAVVVVAALCAFYLKTRLWGPVSLSDCAIGLIFFTPAQFESLWITPNFAHGPLPLLLVVLYCLALTYERAVTRYILALIVNFLAIYTGFALFIGFITPAWLLLEYYSRRRAGLPSNLVFIPLVLSLVSLGSFFVGYNFAVLADCSSVQPRSPTDYLVFVCLLLAHFFGARGSRFFVSIPMGSAILAAMIWTLISFSKRWRESKNYTGRNFVPAVLVGFCLLFCAATAHGRTCFGRSMAFSSRYTDYVALGILGLYFQALGVRAEWPRKIWPAFVVVMLLVGSVLLTPSDLYIMHLFHDTKANWRRCYLRTEDVQECDQATGSWVYPWPERTHLKEKLEFLKQTRQNLYSSVN